MLTFLLGFTDHNNWASCPWWAYLICAVIDAGMIAKYLLTE